jgi:hypothetical protein
VKKAPSAPVARSRGLIVEELPDELVVYDEERHRVHCLGPVAAWIWRACDGRTSAARLAQQASARFDRDIDAGLVSVALDRLLRSRLLAGPRPPEAPDRSRRELLKRAAQLGAALSVFSLTAPTPAQAASCRALGQPCNVSSQCCVNSAGARCCKNGKCSQGKGGCA